MVVAMIWLLNHLHLLLCESDTRPLTSLVECSLPIPLRPPSLGIGFRYRASCPMQSVKDTHCTKVNCCLRIKGTFVVEIVLAWVVPTGAITSMS